LLMEFPFETGDRAFAARVLVEYFNTDRLDFSTDTSWLATDAYYFPATYGDKPVYPLGFVAPKVVAGPGGGGPGIGAARFAISREALPGFTAWRLPIPCDYLDGLNNLYLDVRYQGDRISVRYNGRLIADNLNNNTDWLMDLKRGGFSLGCQELELEVRPWKDIGRMYFDRAPGAAAEGRADIERMRLVPEYRVIITMVGEEK
jgi:beta-galactosidase